MKNVRTEADINILIKEMNRNEFDLVNRYNNYDSGCFSIEEYDEEYLFVTFGRYGRALKIKSKNICKRFYIKETKFTRKVNIKKII